MNESAPKPIRAAVVGAGAIAKQHLGCLRELRGVEVVAVCDLSPAMAEAAAERFGARSWTADYSRMLEERRPQVVHVTTPPASHFSLALAALQSGAHVLVEKPITLDLSELQALAQESRRRGLLLQESHNYQFNRPVQRVVSMIRSGEFGEPVHVEVMMCLDILGKGSRFADPNTPHPLLSAPGGVIADFLTHLAYLAYIFVGRAQESRSIWSKRDKTSPLKHDEFRAMLDCEHGTASLAFSAHARPDTFWLRVHGTRMRASINIFESRISFERVRGGAKPLMPMKNALSESAAFGANAFGSLIRKLSGGPGAYEGLWTMIGRMYDSIRDGGAPPVAMKQIEDVAHLVDDLVRQESIG